MFYCQNSIYILYKNRLSKEKLPFTIPIRCSKNDETISSAFRVKMMPTKQKRIVLKHFLQIFQRVDDRLSIRILRKFQSDDRISETDHPLQS